MRQGGVRTRIRAFSLCDARHRYDAGMRERARRGVAWWLCGGVISIAVVAVAAIGAVRILHPDPCDLSLPFAEKLGLRLSRDDHVVACEWDGGFPDSGGKVVVRTTSADTRDALLGRSEVSEELDRTLVIVDDGTFHEEVNRPNLERSEQVYTSTGKGGHLLQISYDQGVESGLLLTVLALDV